MIGWIYSFLAAKSFVKFCASNKPEYTQARGETEAWYKENFEQPFVDGLNGVQSPPRPKPRLLRTLIIGLVLATTFMAWAWFDSYRYTHPPHYHSVLERR